jgi:hypothetical protein
MGKHFVFSIFIFIAFPHLSSAQHHAPSTPTIDSISINTSITDTIAIVEKEWGTEYFYQKSKIATLTQLVSIVKTNKKASKEALEARGFFYTELLLGATGGSLMAYSLLNNPFKTWENIELLILGTGLVGVTATLAIISLNKSEKAIRIYNKDQKSLSYSDPEFKIFFTGRAAGISLSF